MRKRLFLAINLPAKIKDELVKKQQEIERMFGEECPIKWTRKENLHMTILFIGSVEIDNISEIIYNIEEVLKKNERIIEISFREIDYAPSLEAKRMVWLFGEKEDALENICKNISRGLGIKPDVKFIPHITLGRIIKWRFNRIEPEEVPEINIDFKFNLKTGTIDLMESELKRGGPEYTILKTFQL